MKTCTKCYKEYSDDSLNFCLDDGSPLTVVPGSWVNTAVMHERETRPLPVGPSGMAAAVPSRRASKAIWWVLGILGLSALICGGGLIDLVYLGARSSNNGIKVTTTSPTPVKGTGSTPVTADADQQGSVTRAQFDQIDIGMAKSDVQRIMGSPGDEYYRGKGGDTTFLLLRWADKKYRTILVNFENDKVTSKSQVGLDDTKD